jgi:NADH:ubiquinone oxidoreductase subunit F (NADH-binding)
VTADATTLPRLLATVGRPDLAAHQAQWGARPAGHPRLIAELERAGLTGRGGAGFPASVKWASTAGRPPAVVVANGTEGEPASNKDKTLLRNAPHLVLDGAALAAESVGAAEAIVVVDGAATDVVRTLGHAVAERRRYGIDGVSFRMEGAPPGYVTGEETALVNWINRGDPRPTFGRRPFEGGVAGRPTLVHNVETLAHAALVARFGAGWFAGVGAPDAPGSALVTVTGDVAHPAVFEVPLGARLADVVAPAAPTSGVQALLLGGYAGRWFGGGRLADARLDRSHLGCGSIVVLGERSCGVAATHAIASWLAAESAGQCGPCMYGLPALAEAVGRHAAGGAPARWSAQVDRLMWMVDGRGACKHPDGVVRMVRSALETFASDIEHHRRRACGRPAPALPLPLHRAVPA